MAPKRMKRACAKPRPAEGVLWMAPEIAGIVNASTAWVFKAAKRGLLPHFRIGAMLRFDPEAVRQWVSEQAAPSLTARPIESVTSESAPSTQSEG